MSHIKFIVSLVMISLFAIAIISFAVNFGYDNSTKVNLANDPDLPGIKNNLESDVNVYYTNMNTSSDAMYKSTISSQTEATEGGTAFKVGPTTALTMTYRVITGGYKKIFGSDSGFGIFLTALISVLGFISIMLLYKAWAGRSP